MCRKLLEGSSLGGCVCAVVGVVIFMRNYYNIMNRMQNKVTT
jgi:hypothetical protein